LSARLRAGPRGPRYDRRDVKAARSVFGSVVWGACGLSLAGAVFGVAPVGCASDDDVSIPVAPAPPDARHDALRAALATDARGLSFQGGDWLEDLGDAPFYGLAWLSRRTDLDASEAARRDEALARARALLAEELVKGDLQEKVMAALGLIEHVAATGDRSDVALVDSFVDRLGSLVATFGDYLDAAADQSWAIRTYGPTAVTALVALVHAQYALLVGGDRAGERLDRAKAIERRIYDRSFGDLVDAQTGAAARAFAAAPGDPQLDLYANVAMMLLEARLFRLTHDETYRLQARALYAAIQPLTISDAPARYESAYAAASLGAKTRDVATLSSQNYLALGLLLLFEITGEARFVDEADRVLDGIEQMRGPWCLSQVHTEACAPACGAGAACVAGACEADRCTTGLLHHVVDGRLAQPGDPTLFCSGCNLQTLYVLGYRRALAGEAW
jgi:hypothetical protein